MTLSPKLRVPALACVAGALAVAGCGTGEKGASGVAKTPTDVPAGAAPNGKVVRVSMKDNEFRPKTVTVPAGSTVEWTNDDDTDHTVYKSSGPAKLFNSGTIKPGGSYRQRFPYAGQIMYECRNHYAMNGVVNVR
jgi:plastocyanin